MSKTLKNGIILLIFINLLFIISLALCICTNFKSPYFSIFITVLMFAFHFDFRALSGLIFSAFKNKINVDNKIYNISEKEYQLLTKLKVKSWKDGFFAIDKKLFIIKTINKNNLEYVLKNNINAELIHIFCFFFGFISILIGCLISIEEWYIYLITAIITSFIVDFPPILIQRYNRYRLLKIKNKKF